MSSVLDASWFYWSVGIAVGLPVLLILLTELQNALRRRNSYLAKPVGLLRTYILPLGALLLSDDQGATRNPATRPRCGSSPPSSASSCWCCCSQG